MTNTNLAINPAVANGAWLGSAEGDHGIQRAVDTLVNCPHSYLSSVVHDPVSYDDFDDNSDTAPTWLDVQIATLHGEVGEMTQSGLDQRVRGELLSAVEEAIAERDDE